MKTTIAIVLAIIALSIFTIIGLKGLSLKQNCTGYLKQAADANTVETAKTQLGKSIKYLEEHNMTTGYTSIAYNTPDEDIEFFYNNLKESEKELSKVDSTTSSLEKTNLLMKLRETLLDGGKDGDELTIPKGLSKHPNNLMWGILMTLAVLITLGLFIWASIEFDGR